MPDIPPNAQASIIIQWVFPKIETPQIIQNRTTFYLGIPPLKAPYVANNCQHCGIANGVFKLRSCQGT